MNAEKGQERTVTPIEKGREIKNRRAQVQPVADDPQQVTMRRLKQCIMMAVELAEEASQRQ